jgi:glycosyltransferase involved in cell wall biosynthesis
VKVALVTTFYPPHSFGGDAMHVYRLANELARREHEVTVVHSVDAYELLAHGELGAPLPQEPRVTVHGVRSRLRSLAPVATYLTGRPALNAPVLDEVFADHFDVTHFHNVSLIGGPGVLRYGDGVKLYTMNEHWLVCPMHVLWRDNREPCYEPHCVRCSLAFRRPPQPWRYTSLLERMVQHVDLFLSPSRFTLEAHRTRGFTRPIRHLPYFLPPADEPPAGAAPPHPRPYFLFVGRLERIKGVETLIERFRSYRDADLLVAGSGELDEELRTRAADLDHVHFLGRVEPAKLPQLYASALALIVPSVGFEVSGIVTLEAFAQRTPAIVRDLGALPEAVLDSGGGFVYATEQELTEAMERIRLDPQLRRELGERGYAAWRERWSPEPHMEGYLAAIAEGRELAAR